MSNPTTRQQFDAGPLSDEGERNAIFAVLDSYRQYRRQTHFSTTHRRRQNFYALPKQDQKLLTSEPLSILDTLNKVDDAIDDNADIADAILRLALETFELSENPPPDSELNWHGTCRAGDLTKAHSTIRQFWRDWSSSGYDQEVKPILKLILFDLRTYIRADNGKSGQRGSLPSVLLPGAGLGRLLFELCMAGYDAEGNEISYHQLLASNLILNATSKANQYRLYPFVTSFTNNISRSAQLTSVMIPDVHPGTAVLDAQDLPDAKSGRITASIGEMSMSAGDFITSYSTQESKETFDAVVTVYFVDTAPNLVSYIRTVWSCLVNGGIWINVGPLLWHFDERHHAENGDQEHDGEQESEAKSQREKLKLLNTKGAGIGEPGSFELTDEEVVALLEKMGFQILSHEILSTTVGGYLQDPDSMLQSRYRCSHWIARKCR